MSTVSLFCFANTITGLLNTCPELKLFLYTVFITQWFVNG